MIKADASNLNIRLSSGGKMVKILQILLKITKKNIGESNGRK
jgi:hypothetical protein